jgi:toxin ParE1/3/4
MPTFTLTPAAEQDLQDIWLYIAQDNPRAGDKLLNRIEVQCELLANHPQLGPARDDIAKGLRYHPLANYLILYRTIAHGVEIVRVAHGARNILDLL